MFEAEDAEVATTLIGAAEDWLRGKAMTRAMGPFSLSVWDEPGLLVGGHDHPPTVMMGHHLARYEAWIEAAGYQGVKDLQHLRACAIDEAVSADRAPHRHLGRTRPAHPHPQASTSRNSIEEAALILTHSQRRMVGQLGLCPPDRCRDRLCGQRS